MPSNSGQTRAAHCAARAIFVRGMAFATALMLASFALPERSQAQIAPPRSAAGARSRAIWPEFLSARPATPANMPIRQHWTACRIMSAGTTHSSSSLRESRH